MQQVLNHNDGIAVFEQRYLSQSLRWVWKMIGHFLYAAWENQERKDASRGMIGLKKIKQAVTDFALNSYLEKYGILGFAE